MSCTDPHHNESTCPKCREAEQTRTVYHCPECMQYYDNETGRIVTEPKYNICPDRLCDDCREALELLNSKK